MDAEFRLNFKDLAEAELKEFQTSRFWKVMLRVIIPLMTAPILLQGGYILLFMEPTDNSPIRQGIFADVPLTRLLFLLPFILGEVAFLVWMSNEKLSPIPWAMAREKMKAGGGFSGVHQVAIEENNLW